MILVPLVGFLFGFIGSMPVAGPIAVLVLAAAVEGRARDALYIGLGCAVAEGGYATLAYWGFAELLGRYPVVVPVTRALAAVVLIALGISFIRRRGQARAETVATARQGRSFLLGFSITALNPTLIATWSGASAVLSGFVTLEPALAPLFGLGAGAGIASWYVVVIRLVARFEHRFTPAILDGVIRVTGFFLVGLGAWFAWLFGQYALGA